MSSKESIKIGNNRRIQMDTSFGILPRSWSRHVGLISTGCPQRSQAAIRNMEPAWAKVCQGKFSLTSRTIVQPNGGTREVPCCSLTKMECLYIATNDEVHAKFVLLRGRRQPSERWNQHGRKYMG